MLNRPHDFNEVIGHDVFKGYLIERLKKNTLPQFMIFEGPEGLGKTSLAEVVSVTYNYGFDDTPERRKAISEVIDNRRSIDCIKKFNMAKDSGKDTAKEVLASLSPAMSSTGRMVVLCDECHSMVEAAQDVFLVETEFIPKNTILIMCTTDKSKLKPTLLSRAVCIPLTSLKTSEMMHVLQKEVESRNLTLEGGDAVLRMIAEWADNKPRAALNILNAFGTNDIVTTDVVREFIGYMSLKDVMPLITSLSGSMTYGLTFISDMSIPDSFINAVVEVLRIKLGQPSYKISLEEYHQVRQDLELVPEECIMKFLHQIASRAKLNKAAIISAFTASHVSYERLFKEDKGLMQEEIGQKLANRKLAPDVKTQQAGTAPSIESLLSGSSIVGEVNERLG